MVYSEMAHLYYVTLGNRAGCAAAGDCSLRDASTAPNYLLSNTSSFLNLQARECWTGVALAPRPGDTAWRFDTYDGGQYEDGQDNEFYAAAVLPGDVTASVPEPQSLGLVLLAIGVAALATRMRPVVDIRPN